MDRINHGEGQCAVCGTYFVKEHNSQKYCSDECRRLARNAQARRWREETRPSGWSRCEICGERCPHGCKYCSDCRKFMRDETASIRREERERLRRNDYE